MTEKFVYLGDWTTASGYRVCEYLVAGHMVYMGFGVIGVYKEESA